MRPADSLPALLAFVRDYHTVKAAVAQGAGKPYVTDPTMNAYDFRPISGGVLRPSSPVVFKALRAMGYKFYTGDDRGPWISYTLERVSLYLTYYLGERLCDDKVAHLVNMFRHYTELKEGRKTRWRLLR